ncbi:MAG: TVP38/TMEM64 family protein [Planctomycetota bacterium]
MTTTTLPTDAMTAEPTTQPTNAKSGVPVTKIAVLAVLATVIGGAYWKFGNAETLQWLAAQESALRGFQAENPVLVYGVAFLAYVAVTGLSLPGAALMTLLMGWYFGWGASTVLVSFAATAGATVAFLLSRYLFRDTIQQRFGDKLTAFNEALEREGAFYLFTLRLIPAVPFFVINVVMGLTKLPVTTYWWVSQVGMLAGTAVYCYAGSRIPDLQTLTQEGAGAVFSGSQLLQIGIAFTLLGVFPLAAKKLIAVLRPAS